MSVKYSKLSQANIRSLKPGNSIMEHGIIATRLPNGDIGWRVNIMVDGARYKRSVGKESERVTRTQAEQLIEKFRTEAREGRLNLPKGRKTAIGFEEGADDYITGLTAEGGRIIARKTQHVNSRLKPHFKQYRLDSVPDKAVATFIKARLDEGARPSSINRELATLSHMFRCACRWKWITRDKVPSIPKQKEGPGRIIALSPEQSRKLLDAAAMDQDADLWLFVLICLQTSMRHGEARRLQWQHFDEHRQCFHIPEAKAGERDQPLPDDLVAVLKAKRENLGVDSGYLFTAGPGSKSDYRHTFRKAFRRAVEAAEMDPDQITPHVLRHTAITTLVKANVDLPTVQRVSGHKTLTMVLRYAHVDSIHVNKAVNSLSILAGPATAPCNDYTEITHDEKPRAEARQKIQ